MTIRRSAVIAASLLTGAGVLAAASVHADPERLLLPDTLVISSSTYDNSRGAVASLVSGTTVLPSAATSTTIAVANNDYVHVWDNEGPDASFGVTSPITLTDVDPLNGRRLRTLNAPTDQVVTSFSSKSELSLHLAQSGWGYRLIFVGYGSANVGAIDASNSDAEAGQDPSNPVTFAFGNGYFFHRTIVSLDDSGHLTYTPTVDYGGNNGRSALLGSNGLFYMVGNSNNGSAAAFGAANGTSPDVTETTGLEVVKPINGRNASVTIPANNSAEVDPLIQYPLGKKGALDKPGKDNNYRGVTQFGNALFFTKGSGSNGMDTVYTVSPLPTLANAAAATISVVPGFPTDSARATGGDYTPFAVFFANATTMYVTDEGTGDTTDVSTHAGLEKWSLVSGTWQLDYVLTNGLIGNVDSGLTGSDGPWPDVTSIGLRNLTGVLNSDGTVTLWATTSTKSTSTDNGADPNKVVRITDLVSATILPSGESFQTIAGPTYGTVYRGVAYVCGDTNKSGVCTRGERR